MIEEGLILMVAGMGTVGAFLTIMVFTMHGTSAFLNRYFPEKAPPQSKSGPPSKPKAKTEDLSEVAAAIAAVVARSRC